MKKKVLIAAPIRDRAWVLPEYLDSLKGLDTSGLSVHYFFLVQSSEDASLDVVVNTVIGEGGVTNPTWPNTTVGYIDEVPKADNRYNRIEDGIYSHLQLMRERIRQLAVDMKVDYLFSVDSDIMVRPDTLQKLLSDEKDFVAAILSNTPTGSFTGPNAIRQAGGGKGPYRDLPYWYNFKPEGVGVVPVFATGACFLASRKYLEACTYLPDVPQYYKSPLGKLPGEDMFFAVSGETQGLTQWLDETHRVFHVWGPKQLETYQEARKKYKSKAVEVITDRIWAKEAPVVTDNQAPPRGK